MVDWWTEISLAMASFLDRHGLVSSLSTSVQPCGQGRVDAHDVIDVDERRVALAAGELEAQESAHRSPRSLSPARDRRGFRKIVLYAAGPSVVRMVTPPGHFGPSLWFSVSENSRFSVASAS